MITKAVKEGAELRFTRPAATLLLVAPLVACGASPTVPTGFSSSVSSSSASSETPTSSDTIFEDGRYTIGVDMPAGSYTAAPADSCYWARYDITGKTIENDFTEATYVSVEIEPTDSSFSSEGCGPWTQESAIDPDSPDGDTTKCLLYTAISKSDRQELVQPFLVWERRKRGVLADPSAALVRLFSADVTYVCEQNNGDVLDDPTTDEVTAGVAATVVYSNNKKAYSK